MKQNNSGTFPVRIRDAGRTEFVSRKFFYKIKILIVLNVREKVNLRTS
jgi:hypothetical protein